MIKKKKRTESKIQIKFNGYNPKVFENNTGPKI